jgi:hypothetical protein
LLAADVLAQSASPAAANAVDRRAGVQEDRQALLDRKAQLDRQVNLSVEAFKAARESDDPQTMKSARRQLRKVRQERHEAAKRLRQVEQQQQLDQQASKPGMKRTRR